MLALSPTSRIAIMLGALCLTACTPPNIPENSQVETPTAESPQVDNSQTDLTQDQVRKGYLEHAALAQLHRWYQVYERPEGGIENALDILAQDVIVKSSLGEAKGHDAYKARVANLPKDWKNAHFVESSDIEINDDGSMTLKANITYLNQGMRPDGEVRTADLKYSMALVPGTDVLPKFTQIEISQLAEGETDEMRDAYGENRLLSLVHYWLALIEDPSRNPEPAREILADDFNLNFSSGTISDFDGFKQWLAGPGSQVAASTHIIDNFTYEDLGNDEYKLTVDFDWTGILPDGNEMVAKTRHSWRVTNDVNERFARIKSIDVEVIEPFAPKSE